MIDESELQLLKLQAEICKTLADPKRLMILHELREGEVSVGQLVSNLRLSQANVSQHLAILRERGVVSTRREGATIYYRLTNPRISEACDLVREVLMGQLVKNQELTNSLAPSAKGLRRVSRKGRQAPGSRFGTGRRANGQDQ